MRARSFVGARAALLGVTAAVLLMGTWGAGGVPVQAQEDPVAAVQALIDEFDESGPTGDGAAIAAHFTEDGAFTILEVDGSFGIFGRPAMTAAFSEEPDPDFSVTVVEISATGDTVTGTIEFQDRSTVEAGIERGLADFTAVVSGDLVASLDLVDNLSDPQTAQLAEYLASQQPPPEGGEEGPPPEEFVELVMAGDQEGHAGVGREPFFGEGIFFAFIEVEPGPEGVRQPAGIHEGTCDNLDFEARPQKLAPVSVGGLMRPPPGEPLMASSGNLVSGDFDQLLAEPHAIAVFASEQDITTVVSCADIERAAAPAPTATTTAPALPSTGAGGSDGGLPLALMLALAGAGLATLAGAGALRVSRR
jgi:ketosteroid isomerase-like protein